MFALVNYIAPSARIRRAGAASEERTGTMSYLMVHFWPAGTEEQYRSMIEVLHPGGALPEGQTHHAAGPTEGGFLVSALWDSKEHSDAFGAHIGSVMPIEGGFQGRPEERTAPVVNAQG